MVPPARWLLVIAAISFIGCVGNESTVSRAAREGVGGIDPSPIADLLVYPESTAFCDGRVYPSPSSGGEGLHIVWKAFATGEEHAEVVSFYEDRLQDLQKEVRGEDVTWQFYVDDRVSRALSVDVAESGGPWSECELPRGTRTIIMQSSK